MKDVNPSLVEDFLPKFVDSVNKSNKQREKWLRRALGEEDEDVLTYGESGLFYRAENRAMAKHKAKQKGIDLDEKEPLTIERCKTKIEELRTELATVRGKISQSLKSISVLQRDFSKTRAKRAVLEAGIWQMHARAVMLAQANANLKQAIPSRKEQKDSHNARVLVDSARLISELQKENAYLMQECQKYNIDCYAEEDEEDMEMLGHPDGADGFVFPPLGDRSPPNTMTASTLTRMGSKLTRMDSRLTRMDSRLSRGSGRSRPGNPRPESETRRRPSSQPPPDLQRYRPRPTDTQRYSRPSSTARSNSQSRSTAQRHRALEDGYRRSRSPGSEYWDE